MRPARGRVPRAELCSGARPLLVVTKAPPQVARPLSARCPPRTTASSSISPPWHRARLSSTAPPPRRHPRRCPQHHRWLLLQPPPRWLRRPRLRLPQPQGAGRPNGRCRPPWQVPAQRPPRCCTSFVRSKPADAVGCPLAIRHRCRHCCRQRHRRGPRHQTAATDGSASTSCHLAPMSPHGDLFLPRISPPPPVRRRKPKKQAARWASKAARQRAGGRMAAGWDGCPLLLCPPAPTALPSTAICDHHRLLRQRKQLRPDVGQLHP
mmetsp:Transcript_101013/g.261566  ORF Transcript_101013/g.261566 Transcript_101013/m.261566 type:complete len:265 (+) Transcript_101013:2-796(+)